MNSTHNNGESDKSLNDGLDRLGRAYGQLDQDEPPELLDQAILNSAHRSVERKSHWTQFGWLHGLTTAAVFVLAFSLILNQRESAPVFENGTGSAEPARLQSEKAAKKQSLDVKSELRKETKHKDDTRQDAYQNTSLATAQENEATAGQSRSPAMESRLSGYVQDVTQAKAGPVDEDMEKGERMLEEASIDEGDFMADAPVPAEAVRPAAPTGGAAPVVGPGEPISRARKISNTRVEQKLQAIIELKQSGDPGWEKELESFMESYPDYPLPEELKVP